MPAHQLHWGEAVLSFDDQGNLTGLVHDQWGPYLAGLDVQVVGAAAGSPLVAMDEDEVEVHRDGPVQLDVRHSVLGGWDQRIVAANVSGAGRAATVRLRPVPARDCVLWCWSAGAEAAWLVAPRGEGPLLVVRQRHGGTVDTDGFELGPERYWEAGERRLWHWQAGWLPDHRAAAGLLPGWWPDPIDLPESVPLVITDLDLALDDEDDAFELAQVGDSMELLPAAGAHRLTARLNGARGTTLVEARWAPPLDQVVQAWVSRVLDGAITAGLGRTDLLDSSAEAALVMVALAGSGVADPLRTLDTVEASMPGLLRTDPGPETVLACLGLHAATGDQDWLERAADLVTAMAPRPLGAVAAMNLVTTLAATGQDPGPVAGALARAAAHCATGFDPEGQPVPEDVRAEYAVVLGAGRWDARLRDVARRLGRRLGGGLPGRLSGGDGAERMARETLLLGMLDERGAPEMRQEWLVDPSELAERTSRRLLADLVDDPEGMVDPVPRPGRPTARAYGARVLLPLVLAQQW
ncbi:hypothetical protein GA0111570_10665 [Raineyella antarctica]|uniref:Uncharacterized protein n=1 Tax=Raineyella antarctica TaxID=1577474 RepID=A0A1G6H1Y5_9ACTN|nr:hypothetical protein [Raineyella antarctica]SDB88317.1 hypothetical protein GA0111570_10665 [Raineyella antarctica]